MLSAHINKFKKRAQKERQLDKEFSSLTPLDNAKSTIKSLLATTVQFRVGLLKTAACFAGKLEHDLVTIAQRMDEMVVEKGFVVIQQEDLGDTFFIVEEGTVEVTRKNNFRDPYEESVTIATLGRGALFGEMSLLTEELRSASVTVVSDTAKILSLTKQVFQETLFQSEQVRAEAQHNMAQNVLASSHLFKQMDDLQRHNLLDHMVIANFQPGAFICRQGRPGKKFYILISGMCKVVLDRDSKDVGNQAVSLVDKARDAPTIAAGGKGSPIPAPIDDAQQMEIARMIANCGDEVNVLHPGDFFGEIALLSEGSKITAHVIAYNAVTCMCLDRSDFLSIFKKSQKLMINMHGHQNTGKNENNSSDSSLVDDTGRRRRRITCNVAYQMSADGYVDTILKRMAKFMSHSLYNSSFQRFWRDLLLRPQAVSDAGPNAVEIMANEANHSRVAGIQAIRQKTEAILDTEFSKRTTHDLQFIYGLIRQRNTFLESKFLHGWTHGQIVDLCRYFTFHRYLSCASIIKVNTVGSNTFLILRGAVRILSEHFDARTKRVRLQYEEDLCAGEYFGEVSLEGLHHRTVTALALTDVEVMLIEHDDYINARGHGAYHAVLSAGAKYEFLSPLPLFKHSNKFTISKFAHALSHEEVIKGTRVMTRGKENDLMYFILQGTVDLVRRFPTMDVGSSTIAQIMEAQQNTIASLREGDYFGESGVINTHFRSVHHSHVQRHGYSPYPHPNYVECCDAIATTHLEVLAIPAIDAIRWLEGDCIALIVQAFSAKTQWREGRMLECKKQVKQFRQNHRQQKLTDAIARKMAEEQSMALQDRGAAEDTGAAAATALGGGHGATTALLPSLSCPTGGKQTDGPPALGQAAPLANIPRGPIRSILIQSSASVSAFAGGSAALGSSSFSSKPPALPSLPLDNSAQYTARSTAPTMQSTAREISALLSSPSLAPPPYKAGGLTAKNVSFENIKSKGTDSRGSLRRRRKKKFDLNATGHNLRNFGMPKYKAAFHEECGDFMYSEDVALPTHYTYSKMADSSEASSGGDAMKDARELTALATSPIRNDGNTSSGTNALPRAFTDDTTFAEEPTATTTATATATYTSPIPLGTKSTRSIYESSGAAVSQVPNTSRSHHGGGHARSSHAPSDSAHVGKSGNDEDQLHRSLSVDSGQEPPPLPSLKQIPELLKNISNPITAISTCKTAKEVEHMERDLQLTRRSKAEKHQHLKSPKNKSSDKISPTKAFGFGEH